MNRNARSLELSVKGYDRHSPVPEFANREFVQGVDDVEHVVLGHRLLLLRHLCCNDVEAPVDLEARQRESPAETLSASAELDIAARSQILSPIAISARPRLLYLVRFKRACAVPGARIVLSRYTR
jgi:hypothetical protein